jgi:flagellar L-ring protein precursor FlgH
MKTQNNLMRVLVAMLLWCAGVPGAMAGTLYHQDAYQPLTSDTRSFRVGDALTVMIVENSNAQSEADSTATRETNISLSPQDSIHQYTVGADIKRNAGGKGETNRTGSLTAQISVRVQQVAANGDLAVYGIQKITINGEVQTITVSGVVRPIDVSADNTVLSTRLTNSEIAYNGRGFVDRNQEESWISRLLGWLGL